MNLKTIPQSLWFAGFLLALSVPAAYAQGEAARDFKGKIGFDLKESVEAWPQETRAPRGAPNVIVVLLDDVGYAATSVFGGPVPTPELERLAATGLRYNNFHTTAYCSASRAALLSGRNDHRVGFGVISETVQGFPGYNGIWRKDTTSMPEVLRRNGYSTAAFGKWHNTPPWEITPVGPFDRWPTGLGFEYFYGFMGAQTNQWYPKLYRNTRPASPVKTPEQGYYLNTDLADDAIRWLHVHESQAPDKPYLLYFAPGATHEPLQAPREWIEKYRGRFDGGYDRLRQEIFDRQKKLGVIPANSELTPRPAELPGWDSFSADQKRLMARQMEVYAAFLAHTDHEIGRIIQAAREGPHGDNTLVLFIAGDNGASAEGGFTGYEISRAQTLGQRLARLDEMGGVVAKGSSLYASGWAYALSSPFQWAKRIASHYGGTTVPLVVSWPARIKDQGGLRPQFSHLNDIAATVLEAAGIAAPEVVDGVKQLPMDGTSLVYSFDQPQAPSTHTLQIFEQVGNRAIYHDGWVAAVRHAFPWNTPQDQNSDFRSDIWELYHVAEDFSQARNLAAQNPEKLKELQALFEAEARKNDIYPLMLRKPTSHPMPNDGRRGVLSFIPRCRPPQAGFSPSLPDHRRSDCSCLRRRGRPRRQPARRQDRLCLLCEERPPGVRDLAGG
jgi:arylsulfatase A-like enzyme